MKTIIWDTTYFCPLQCVYCYSDSGPWHTQTSKEKVLAVAEAIVRERPSAVMISGGEATVAKGILEVGKMFKENGIVSSIFTSGWGISASRLKKICDVFDHIHVSIDSSDHKKNDRIRGRTGAYSSAMNTLHLLSAKSQTNSQLRFGVECTVVRENLAGIEEYVHEMSSIPGIRFINIVSAVPSGRASEAACCESELLSNAELAQLENAIRKMKRDCPECIELTLNSTDFLQNDEASCVQIDSNGGLRAIKICEKTVGNLIDESLDTLISRAYEWRENSIPAKQLQGARSFSDWGNAVREVDKEAKKA